MPYHYRSLADGFLVSVIMNTKFRLFFLYLSLLVSCLSLHAETSQPLLRIDGKAISADEFTYFFKRSAQRQKQTPAQFFPYFLDFKLKVADAQRMKLDTLPDFQNQYRALQASLLQSMLTDDARKSERCRSLYSQHASRLSQQEWIRMEEIVLRLPQHATAEEDRKVRQTADSIYAALNRGASFSDLAATYATKTEQTSSWQPVSRLLDEVAQQLALLPEGGYSQPFYSPVGIHLIKLNKRKSTLNLEEIPDWVSSYILHQHSTALLNQPLYEQWITGTLNVDTLPFRELYEGLLVTFREAQNPKTEPTPPCPKELEAFFKKHKANYRWDLPHFRGAVIHCKDKKAASKIKKQLKKLPEEEWGNQLAALARIHPELKAEIEIGLFQIGTNCYVDKLAFKCGSFAANPVLPYTFILGKRLKKGPKKYTDVYQAVEKDYIKQLQTEQISDLKQRFNVEINQYVLKTVNCSGSN